MDCYPNTVGKNVLLWLLAVTSNETKMLSLKIGLPSLGVYYVNVSSYKDHFPATAGKDFFYIFLWLCSPQREGNFEFCNASKYIQVYNLLPHHYWQGFFALVCCAVTSNEAKMLPQKMGLPCLGVVAFSQVR